MALQAGDKLGPYEIVAPLGAGGMGEVYRAADTRLDRQVAIKVLPPTLSANDQFRARFEREAKTISQLNHPHICTLYDVGSEGGVEFLVMEYLEGESLAERLERGALPLDEAIRYGIQVADALDRAHREGIVHRDLKPGNVMITGTGAKLLDFGLAKIAREANEPTGDLSALPTERQDLTEEGTILGTVQYMAPEQLESREADARTDIFAFGMLLFEMIVGRKAFQGKSRVSLMAAILEHQAPSLTSLQPLSPPALDRLIRTCLEKLPDDRWQTAHDVKLQLRWIEEGGSEVGLPAPITARRRNREKLWMAATALLLVIAAALALPRLRPETEIALPILRLSLARPAQAPYDGFRFVQLSPDGESVVFIAHTADGGRSLWVRELSSEEARQLPGTEGANLPFWSADGRYLGFFADGKLKRIDVSGGPAQILCDAADATGGDWSAEGVILFAPNGGDAIHRIDAAGGEPQRITTLLPVEESHRWPVFLPDGRHFVFLGDAQRREDHYLKLGSLGSAESTRLFQAVTQPVFSKSGHLLFVRGGSLLAQRFDTESLRPTGEPVSLADQLVENGPGHHFEFSVSDTGLLTHRSASTDSQLTWVDRAGQRLGKVGERGGYGLFDLSADGRRLVYERLDVDGRVGDLVWVDLSRGQSSRLPLRKGASNSPIWSPQGDAIVFAYAAVGPSDLYRMGIEGTNEPELLFGSAELEDNPTSWSADGRLIVFERYARSGIVSDLWILELGEEPTAEPLLATPFNEFAGKFSPDGRWIAYVSDASGRDEVHLLSFPEATVQKQVSTNGGWGPQWRGDSRELFYLDTAGRLMTVEVEASDGGIELSTPQELFTTSWIQGPNQLLTAAQASSDGLRFLVAQPLEAPLTVPVTVVTNWTAELPEER